MFDLNQRTSLEEPRVEPYVGKGKGRIGRSKRAAERGGEEHGTEYEQLFVEMERRKRRRVQWVKGKCV